MSSAIETIVPEVPPFEGHFHICSPLSVLTYPSQVAWKRQTLEALLGPIATFIEAKEQWGYRKKVEFSFYADEGGLSFAFFNRGGRGMEKLPLGCALASPKMNATALSVLHVLNEDKIPKRTLKTVIVIESKKSDERIAALYIKDKPFVCSADELGRRSGAENLLIIHSDYRSPASVITEILSATGATTLAEQVLDVSLAYPFDSFFQNNVPVFEDALRHMQQWIEPGSSIVDLYCGVGTIGIALGKSASLVFGIETHAGMVGYAMQNAKANGLENYEAIAGPVEKLLGEQMRREDIVIVDPPRSGLHQKVIQKLNEVKPRRIVYLSCNPETQARDLSLLEGYIRKYAAGFDMYPGTLHMESLVVLDRI